MELRAICLIWLIYFVCKMPESPTAHWSIKRHKEEIRSKKAYELLVQQSQKGKFI